MSRRFVAPQSEFSSPRPSRKVYREQPKRRVVGDLYTLRDEPETRGVTLQIGWNWALRLKQFQGREVGDSKRL